MKKWPFFGYFRHFCGQNLRNRKGLEFYFCVFRRFRTPSLHKCTTTFYSRSNQAANHDICGLMCEKMGKNGHFLCFQPFVTSRFWKTKTFFLLKLYFLTCLILISSFIKIFLFCLLEIVRTLVL